MPSFPSQTLSRRVKDVAMTFRMIAPGAGRLNHMPEACRVRLTPGICRVTLPPEWNTVHGVTRSACDCVRRGLEFSRRGLINHKWRGRGGQSAERSKSAAASLRDAPEREKETVQTLFKLL